jgi:sugar phosphate isomerase/epimerase
VKDSVQQNLLYNASLSTMWAKRNFPTLPDFFAAARQMGFTAIELNHQVDSTMLAGFDLQEYTFSSIHEPCPADISTDTLKAQDWLISASDEPSRLAGVHAIQRSIDMAHELGIGVVVVHAGNVQADLSLEIQMRALHAAGQSQSEACLALMDAQVKTRSALVGPRLEAVHKSLLALLDYAAPLGVRLGLENRYHYMDIPTPDELGNLLDLADAERLGFVLDVGHAQALDRLGFFSVDAWLKRYAARIIGVHLHDVIGLNDHFAPGLGEIDFSHLAPYLPPDAFRTLELHPQNTAGQVIAGLNDLAEHGCINIL